MLERQTWMTDRFGAECQTPVTTEEWFKALGALDGSDDEHNSVSLTDDDGWNLEFTSGWVLLENVAEDGEEVGRLSWENKLVAIQVASEFLSGDFDSLFAHSWTL